MNKSTLDKLTSHLNAASPDVLLRGVLDEFSVSTIALASSFGAEDQVLTDMLLTINPQARIFTLDTGRLPQETYDVMTATIKKYGITYEVMFPHTEAVEKMESEHGPNLFYESLEQRKLCCQLRKLEPLKRKLGTLNAWICGLRREQAVTRTAIDEIEWDEAHQLVKINPLAGWTETQVWDYIKHHDVPYNALHDHGYPSIGCAPCTRAVQPGDDARAGRWWWEQPEHKECGLHLRK